MLLGTGVRNVRIICPWSQPRHITSGPCTDPVHMGERGFSVLADLVLTGVKQNEGMDLEAQMENPLDVQMAKDDD